ncbi:outer membrane porin [Synechococcus sp. PROS-9-1]|uniref:iron uptake porin n=1 Tax=Synechococcus sp. PROS-9-1 TaxID=1968775 RepID=UPI001645466E|nr:iron uptake porin [Synechococcus sp. PROS-9-1]QNJ32882.1 outer membrane porin [Synechococcus sp. PROS-9-1]
MKLFHQLLVAPAALGLLAPMAANATELNFNGVSDYAATGEQVTSITQFSDVYPTDWAYQALGNLVERYGCVAGYPNGTFRGNRAMTRFEAAALLNACLDRVTEVTDELKMLMKEFSKELAILKGRVDGLEAKVGELEAQQFSTTTKMTVNSFWALGATTYGGDAKNPAGGDLGDATDKADGATSFSYDLRIFLDTSFTGEDLLRTRLRSANISDVYAGNGVVGLWSQEYGYQTGNNLELDRLFYQFPVADEFTFTGGPMVRQDDMLAVWPAAYPAAMTVDFFTYAGAPGAYNLALGAGAGVIWSKDDFNISASYLSTNGNGSDPDTGGIATDGAGSNGTVQLSYAPEQWGVAVAYNYGSTDNGVGLYSGNGTPLANKLQANGVTNSAALSAWWMPEETGIIPSVSAGWGINSTNSSADGNGITYDGSVLESSTSQSWYVGLQWDDAFLEGNALGFAVGQPTFVTSIDKKNSSDDFVADGNYAFELFYNFQVTDNISVTPAVHYFSRPLGGDKDSTVTDGDSFNSFGGMIKTTFVF